eukprot:5037241-Pyramimonas_sp.AAC.1
MPSFPETPDPSLSSKLFGNSRRSKPNTQDYPKICPPGYAASSGTLEVLESNKSGSSRASSMSLGGFRVVHLLDLPNATSLQDVLWDHRPTGSRGPSRVPCNALHRPHLLDQSGRGPVHTQSARHSRWEALLVRLAKQGASLAQRLRPGSASSDSTLRTRSFERLMARPEATSIPGTSRADT